jgi:branched-chain amino acid transport system substrate-binding protein
MKRLTKLTTLLILVAILLTSCKAAAEPTEVAPPEVAPTEAAPAEAPTEEAAPAVPAECADNEDESVCAVFEPGDVIKIGYAGPTAGDYSAFGIDISQGGLIAIDDYGVFGDWTISLLIEDTGGSGEGGAAVANLYSSNPDIVAISGHTFSGSTAASIPIYNKARLPMLSASATRADLTSTADQDVFNRIPFTDDIQGTEAAKYLYEKLGVRKLAVMHDGDAYGQGLAERVKEVYESLGGEVVDFLAITPGETDYSAPLSAVAALEPEAVFYGGYDAEAVVLVNGMKVAGLEGVIFFGDDGTFGQKFLDLAGENGEGAYATALVPPVSEAKEKFDVAYEAKFGDKAGSLSPYTWNGYDVVVALIDVIKQEAIVGEDGNLYIPREAMVEGVRNLSGGFTTITGDIVCSEIGECNTAGPTFYIVQNGEWVEAP